ncbi:MAG: CIA30 family protein [Candidatus Margulisiibacteriota bacterium]
MNMKLNNAKMILGAFIALVLVTIAIAGTTHTEGGLVYDAGDGTAANGSSWRVFRADDATPQIISGTVGSAVSGAWYGDIGAQLDADLPIRPNGWLVGDDHLCIIDKETNAGEASHKGYYAVINHDLTSNDPDASDPCTLRAIPVPIGAAGDNQVSLTWTASSEDPGTPVRTNITGYRILRSTSQTGPFTFLTTVEGSTSYTDSTAVNGTTYYYVIQLVYRIGAGTAFTSTYYSGNSNAVTPGVAPAVTAVTPNTGVNTSTTSVTIEGANFAGVVAVNIGTWPVSSYTVVNPTSITAVIPSGLPAATYHVTVTNGSGTSAASSADQFTVTSDETPGVTIIDDYEDPNPRIYYNAGDVPPTYSVTTADKYEGAKSIQVGYSYTGSGWGGLVGGVLPNSLDISSATGISFWVKGDGSSNTIRIDLKEATNEAPANGEVYSSTDISLSNTGWHKVDLPYSAFVRNPYDGVTGGNNTFDKNIYQYQLMYTGTNTSGVSHYVDYIVAETVSVSGSPTVASVTPNTGTRDATTSVTIAGTNFGGTTAVKIGTWDATSFTVNSAIEISAVIPSGLPVSTYHVTVTNGYGTSSTSSADQFTVTSGGGSGVVIDDFEFYAGKDSRGMMNFYYESGAGVDEATIPAPANSTTVKAEGARSMVVTYPGAAGTQWGGYWGGGLDSETKDLTPYTGISLWVKGDGTNNTVGINLQEAAVAGVTQEVYASPSFALTDTNWHKIEIPFSAFVRDPSGRILEGVFSKEIKGYTTIYRGSQTTSAQHYVDYIAAENVSVSALPTVTSVTPNTGTRDATTSITIAGTNFGGTTAVKIGTWDAASFTVNSATEISAVVPSGLPAGTYHVTATNGYGTSSASSADQFTVTDPVVPSTVPTITGIAPNTGENTTSTEVTITGTNLDGATGVHIGTFEMSIISITPTQIIARTPSGIPAGEYHITVTTPNGTSAETPNDIFTVTAPAPSSDTTLPVISEVAFDGKRVLEKDFVGRTPVITALLTDNISIDPSSINVQIVDSYDINTVPSVVFDALTGRMTLAISSPLPYGEKILSISVKDTSGNEAQYGITIKIGNGEDGPVFNYPNPFDPGNESTKIGFNLRDNAQVVVYLFDITGRIVVKRPFNATVGYNEFEWNGVDDYGTIASNGVYLLRLVSENRLIGKTKIWVIKR